MKSIWHIRTKSYIDIDHAYFAPYQIQYLRSCAFLGAATTASPRRRWRVVPGKASGVPRRRWCTGRTWTTSLTRWRPTPWLGELGFRMTKRMWNGGRSGYMKWYEVIWSDIWIWWRRGRDFHRSSMFLQRSSLHVQLQLAGEILWRSRRVMAVMCLWISLASQRPWVPVEVHGWFCMWSFLQLMISRVRMPEKRIERQYVHVFMFDLVRHFFGIYKLHFCRWSVGPCASNAIFNAWKASADEHYNCQCSYQCQDLDSLWWFRTLQIWIWFNFWWPKVLWKFWWKIKISCVRYSRPVEIDGNWRSCYLRGCNH